MNNDKYLQPLQKVAHDHFDIVQNEVVAFRIAKLIASGFQGKCNISESQLKALGTPPAQRNGDNYLIDLGDPKVVGALWMRSCYNAIQLGLYASTDISDSINLINNENLDGKLSDREAMIAVSHVTIAGMDGFRKMKSHIDEQLRSV